MQVDRRAVIAGMAALAPAGAGLAQAPRRTAGAVGPAWDSLAAGYRTPDWFRDAKFGLWAHWGPQSVPEQGDWYGRFMYLQGHPVYDHHRRTYGHPCDTGMIDLQDKWTASRWDPQALIARYRRAGAKYFVALACHHDNLDCYASRYHPWNSVRVGPKRDVVGIWAHAARAAGLRFGVSNHAAHAWHWFQTAYGYDPEGARRGERYDAARLTRADGRGRWWDGLDPQALYTGPNIEPPAGIDTIAAMHAWHDTYSGPWNEVGPVQNPGFIANWLRRQNDLVDRYRPDLCYFDNSGLPFGSIGLEAAAHYYNGALARSGRIDVVLTAKKLVGIQRQALVEDVERGFVDDIRADPWQTDTCIGDWFYNAARPRDRSYKSARDIVQRLADVVSKNGNLLVSIPQRGDGSIDREEEKILDQLADWFARNGEAIYATRPWRRYGEGPTRAVEGAQNEDAAKPFTVRDIRYTTKAGALYALLLGEPRGDVVLTALAPASLAGAAVARVSLLGGAALAFRQEQAGLRVTLPPATATPVPALKIEGRGLA